MSLRRALLDAVTLEGDAFRERAEDVATEHALPGVQRTLSELDRSAFGGPAPLDDYERLPARSRALVWRLSVFDSAPLGLTLCGPAYRDTPIIYATRTFRELTGYSMPALRGENPRLLQGPETQADAVAALREAITAWSPVTVELRNYARDGTPFRNRVSLVPVAGDDGTVTNWVGVQERVATPEG